MPSSARPSAWIAALYSRTRRSSPPIRKLQRHSLHQSRRRGDHQHLVGVGEEFRSDDIVTFYDAYSTEDGYINLVMEYMEGGSLKDLIARGGCRNETVLRRIGLGVTRALSHLHKNKFLHRDVKPANVLLSVDGKVHSQEKSIHFLCLPLVSDGPIGLCH